jgi:hypothetical protein
MAEYKVFNCLHCHEEIVATEAYLQKKVQCPHCRDIVKVPSFLKNVSEKEFIPLNVLLDFQTCCKECKEIIAISEKNCPQCGLSQKNIKTPKQDPNNQLHESFFSAVVFKNKFLLGVAGLALFVFFIGNVFLSTTVKEGQLSGRIEEKLMNSLSQSKHWAKISEYSDLVDDVDCTVQLEFSRLEATKNADGDFVTKNSGGVTARYKFRYKGKVFFEGGEYSSYPGKVETINPIKQTAFGMVNEMKKAAGEKLLDKKIGNNADAIISLFLSIEEVGKQTGLTQYEASVAHVIQRKNACVLEDFPKRRLPEALSIVNSYDIDVILWPILFSKFHKEPSVKNKALETLSTDSRIKLLWPEMFSRYPIDVDVQKTFANRLNNSKYSYKDILDIRFKYPRALTNVLTIISKNNLQKASLERVITYLFEREPNAPLFQRIFLLEKNNYKIFAESDKFIFSLMQLMKESTSFKKLVKSLVKKESLNRLMDCIIKTFPSRIASRNYSYDKVFTWLNEPDTDYDLACKFVYSIFPCYDDFTTVSNWNVKLLDRLSQKTPNKKWQEHHSIAFFDNEEIHGLGEVIGESGQVVTAAVNLSLISKATPIKVWVLDKGVRKQLSFTDYKVQFSSPQLPYVKIQIPLNKDQKTIPFIKKTKTPLSPQFAYALTNDGKGSFKQRRAFCYKKKAESLEDGYTVILANGPTEHGFRGSDKDVLHQSTLILTEDGEILGFFDVKNVFSSRGIFPADGTIGLKHDWLNKYKKVSLQSALRKSVKNKVVFTQEEQDTAIIRSLLSIYQKTQNTAQLMRLAHWCYKNKKEKLCRAYLKFISEVHQSPLKPQGGVVYSPDSAVLPDYVIHLYKTLEMEKELMTLAEKHLTLDKDHTGAVTIKFQALLKENRQQECESLLNASIKTATNFYQNMKLYGQYAVHFNEHEKFRSHLRKKRFKSDQNDLLEAEYGWPQGSKGKLLFLPKMAARNAYGGLEVQTMYLRVMEILVEELNFKKDHTSADFIYNLMKIYKSETGRDRKLAEEFDVTSLKGDTSTKMYSFLRYINRFKLERDKQKFHTFHELQEFLDYYKYTHSSHENLLEEISSLESTLTGLTVSHDKRGIASLNFLKIWALCDYALKNSKTLSEQTRSEYEKKRLSIFKEFVQYSRSFRHLEEKSLPQAPIK